MKSLTAWNGVRFSPICPVYCLLCQVVLAPNPISPASREPKKR